MKIMTNNGWILTKEDTHYEFWKHLKNGGKVWRDDPLNGVREVIRADMLKDCIDITLYGYKSLICIEKEHEPFYYDYLEDYT